VKRLLFVVGLLVSMVPGQERQRREGPSRAEVQQRLQAAQQRLEQMHERLEQMRERLDERHRQLQRQGVTPGQRGERKEREERGERGERGERQGRPGHRGPEPRAHGRGGMPGGRGEPGAERLREQRRERVREVLREHSLLRERLREHPELRERLRERIEHGAPPRAGRHGPGRAGGPGGHRPVSPMLRERTIERPREPGVAPRGGAPRGGREPNPPAPRERRRESAD
jgi:hypothetical protein